MLSLLKRKPIPGGLTAVVLDQGGFSLARIDRDHSGKPILELSLFKECSSRAELGRSLTAAVRSNGLHGAPCIAVLRPAMYSLRQIEAPAVQPEEMQEAARWSVKDLIDFPAEDAVIDIFDVPKAGSSREHRIYVVATRSSTVEETADLIHGSGLSLKAIDVAELAFRNLAALLPEDHGGVATMYLGNEAGVLTITRRGSLYLARRLHADPDLLAEGESYEPGAIKPEQSEEAEQMTKSLLLETQRSLDYYEHQLELGQVTTLILVPLETPLAGLRRFLAANRSVDVSVLDLSGILRASEDLSQPFQTRCLMAIGGALREESEAA